MSFVEDGIEQITPEELLEIVNDADRKVILIDVRELEEYVSGHIAGVPLIPMNTIPEKLDELDSDQTYIFICKSGGRSQNVARYLKANGYENVMNYSGGMMNWQGPIEITEE